MERHEYIEDCYVLGWENQEGVDHHKVFYSVRAAYNHLKQLKENDRIAGYFLVKGMRMDHVDDR